MESLLPNELLRQDNPIIHRIVATKAQKDEVAAGGEQQCCCDLHRRIAYGRTSGRPRIERGDIMAECHPRKNLPCQSGEDRRGMFARSLNAKVARRYESWLHHQRGCVRISYTS